jgi:hypothetical protein
MTRKFTIKLLEAMDEGLIDPKSLAQNLMGYMSEREVESFARAEGYFDHEEEDDEDPNGAWNDTSAELH